MSNITGNEPIYPTKVDPQSESENKNYWFDGSDIVYFGITLRQHAQLEFMKALVSKQETIVDTYSIPAIKETATELTNAYIESLNK